MHSSLLPTCIDAFSLNEEWNKWPCPAEGRPSCRLLPDINAASPLLLFPPLLQDSPTSAVLTCSLISGDRMQAGKAPTGLTAHPLAKSGFLSSPAWTDDNNRAVNCNLSIPARWKGIHVSPSAPSFICSGTRSLVCCRLLANDLRDPYALYCVPFTS